MSFTPRRKPEISYTHKNSNISVYGRHKHGDNAKVEVLYITNLICKNILPK